ncbi:hypothetical protein FB45DRAFT_1003381 [Roridomyces roridus]|uniref:Uncharacterized protein n=1 Tax=Roridomyces roridus TaxID=1738132 RepID=A0AAD7BXT2_9AGAR|nr:hypothetical protein FB45DRAFT_1003381 [Roridomyces roridus]
MITHKRAKDCSTLSNPYGQGPCDLLLNVICGSTPPESCACSSATYFITAACENCLSKEGARCMGPPTLAEPHFLTILKSWNEYSTAAGCGGGRDFTAPVPWTPPITFDAQAATNLVVLIPSSTGVVMGRSGSVRVRAPFAERRT